MTTNSEYKIQQIFVFAKFAAPTNTHIKLFEDVKVISETLDVPVKFVVLPTKTNLSESKRESLIPFDSQFSNTNSIVEFIELNNLNDSANVIVLPSNKKKIYESLFTKRDIKCKIFTTKAESFDTETTKLEAAIETNNLKAFSQTIAEGYDAKQFFRESKPKNQLLEAEVSESRNAFYTGKMFTIGETVKDSSGKYEIIDRGSNYVTVVDESGNASRKFVDGLVVIDEHMNFREGELSFKGHLPSSKILETPLVKEAFDKTIQLFEAGEVEQDAFAVLKAMKEVENLLEGKIEQAIVDKLCFSLKKIGVYEHHQPYLQQYEQMVQVMNEDNQTKLQAAKIIAGAVGSTTTGNDAEAILNNALRKAKTSANPKQIEILKGMLELAKKVGLKYDQSLVESMDDVMTTVGKHYRMLKEKPTKDVLAAHKELRKIGVEYEVRDVGGKREMIKDIISHSHGPRTFAEYRSLPKAKREEMNEISLDTVKSYSDKAKKSSVAGKKDPLKAAINRFKGQERATDRMHSAELKKMRQESFDDNVSADLDQEKEILGYDLLRKKLSQASMTDPYNPFEPVKEVPLPNMQGTVVSGDAQRRPGFSLNHSNETHRKQLVKKLTD